jgi:polar amino acid transport system substrate-binding protein
MTTLMLSAALILVATTAQAKPALDRVIAANTIRCGYIEYAPALTNENGTWKGFNADIIKAVAQKLELKYEFATATGWGTIVADLESGKFDMMCSAAWVHPNAAKFSIFSRPIMYQPIFVVARADDKRFSDKTNLDDPNLKMVTLDGDTPVNIAINDFPKAKMLTLPALSDFSEVLVNVADSKADFTLVDAYTFGAYNKNNPGKLRIIGQDKPIRVYPLAYEFHKEDVVFRDAVNAALEEMVLDGTMDKIMQKYDDFPLSFYRAARSYTDPYKR